MNFSSFRWAVAIRLTTVAALVAFWAAGGIALGQDKAKEEPKKEEEKDKFPEPENVSLETKDGVSIKATYYASKLKKKAVPIIMLHGWGGNRGD